MNDAVLSAEEEQGLYTQPEAEAVDLMVDLDSLKCKITTQVDKTSKKKHHPEIFDTDLDGQLKQVSIFNTNIFLLHVTAKDKEGDTEEMPKKNNQILHFTRSWQEVILMVGGLRTDLSLQTSKALL